MTKILRASLWLVAVLYPLLVGGLSRADEFTVEVGVTPSALYDGTGSQTPIDTGMLPQTSVTVDPTTVSYSNANFSGTATAGGTASLGSLTGTVSAGTTVNNNEQGNGDAVFVGIWTDTLTVDSSTLANGTPVELLFTLDTNTTSACTGTGSVSGGAVLNINGGFEQLSSSPITCNSTLTQSLPIDFMTSVGATVDIEGALTLNAAAYAGGIQGGGIGTASIDPSAGFYIDSETAGASYTTASGTNYETPASSVPEPSSLLLLAAGLLGLLALAARSKRLAPPAAY